jgi:hypothetical protein
VNVESGILENLKPGHVPGLSLTQKKDLLDHIEDMGYASVRELNDLTVFENGQRVRFTDKSKTFDLAKKSSMQDRYSSAMSRLLTIPELQSIFTR